jgi:hypothetical protein
MSRPLAITVAAAMAWPSAALGAVTHRTDGDAAGKRDDEEAVRARVGVLPLVIVGDTAPEIGDARDRLSTSVYEAFSHTSYDAVLLEADVAGDAENPYCADAVCWQMFADEHGVTHFLVVVVVFDEPDYRIEARLVDGRTGESVGTRTDACDLCGITELGERVQDVSASMRRDVEATLVLPPKLIIESVPPGAMVTVDGERVGKTPLTIATISGRHVIEIASSEYVTEKIEVDLTDGVRREVIAKLRPRPAAPAVSQQDTAADPRSRLLFGLGATGLVLGTGLLAGGGAMIAIHGDPIDNDCSGDNLDALGRCRYLHDTRGAGIGLVVGGAALLAGGVLLTVLGARRRKRTRDAQPRVEADLRGFGVVGRF